MFQDVILVYAAVNCETSTNRVFSFGVGDLKTTKIVASFNGFPLSTTAFLNCHDCETRTINDSN